MTLQIFVMICRVLLPRCARGPRAVRAPRCRGWLRLALVLTPCLALADTSVTAARLERTKDLTRVVIESRAELRFSLSHLRDSGQLALELDDVTIGPVLAGLAEQIGAHDPYLKSLLIRPSPSRAGSAQLVFGLKREIESKIVALRPQTGQGYRLVLEVAAPAPAAISPLADRPGISISAATLERIQDRTRLVIESKEEIHFSLIHFTNSRQLELELEGVTMTPALEALANQIAVDHPYLASLLIRPSPSGAKAVQLVFGLKREVESSILALRPQAGQGYRLVLEMAPPAATAAAPAPSAAGQQPLSPADDSNLLLLEVRLDDSVLAESVTSYQYGRETFLPLGELARLLTLAIRTQPEQGTADGFVLSEARGFNLNVAQARLTLADQTQIFDRGLVRLRSEDIYVASSLLARWLPLDLEIDRSSLTLRVKPRERLPLQERLDRERLGARAGSRTGYQDPGYPREDLPYRVLDVPFIDQTFGVGVRAGNGTRQNTANYTAFATGDLAGLESSFFVSSNQDAPTPDVRFTLGRHDPDAALLGPLHARSVMFGSGVAAPSVANVSLRTATGNGYGLTLGNRPFTQPTSFDRHTLQGDLPPGWDVELYFNEALVGFQSSRADGRYIFEDQPLAYGVNEFRLVFHGPLGQQRVERQSFLLEQASTPPGAFYYSLAHHEDKVGQTRSVAQFEWGMSKYLTATGGLVRLPTPVDTGTMGSNTGDGRLYSNMGLRAFWSSFIFNSDFYHAPDGGALNDLGVKTRAGGISMGYSHMLFKDYVSEVYLASADPLRTRDKLRLDGAIAAGSLPRLPLTLEVLRDEFQSGNRNLAVTGRVAAYLSRTSVSNQLTWQDAGGVTTSSGALQLSRRVGDLGMSGQLGYSLRPNAQLDTVVLAVDKRLAEGYLLNLGLVRSVGSGETVYAAGLNKSLGSYGLGVSTSYSSTGVYTVGLQLFIAMGRDPQQQKWRYSALPKADNGAASARVFLDNNGNGVMDPGDEPIENAAMTVNGGRTQMRTDADGRAWIDNLPVRQHVDIAVDTQTLEDPYWAPQRKGVRLVPRPGRVAELDFPVVLTSEIDGTVYLIEGGGRRGIGDVVLELLDSRRSLVSTTKSSSDGYYVVPAVPQGRYYLRVSPEQLRKLELSDPGLREITVLPDGRFINGVDFSLSRNPTGPTSRRPSEESHEKR